MPPIQQRAGLAEKSGEPDCLGLAKQASEPAENRHAVDNCKGSRILDGSRTGAHTTASHLHAPIGTWTCFDPSGHSDTSTVNPSEWVQSIPNIYDWAPELPSTCIHCLLGPSDFFA